MPYKTLNYTQIVLFNIAFKYLNTVFQSHRKQINNQKY